MTVLCQSDIQIFESIQSLVVSKTGDFVVDMFITSP